MSVRICTSEYMLSTVDGVDMARHWFPRVVAESFLESKKDGEIKLSPDPVTMIDGDLTWFNATKDPQWVTLQVQRAPRDIVAQSPSTVLIHDAVSIAKGVSPQAEFPSVHQDTFGGRSQLNRGTNAPKDLEYGRLFLSCDTSSSWETIGEVPAGHSIHVRYLAAVQTPGAWIIPSEFEPRWEAYARWARLIAFAGPVGSR
ncbi:hypothetical protein SEA_CEPENS_30 [Mycobacterium phage Cepens]|nr:hypothetical protein SEA_CEPENS_30 [Mycobacterium phage Cepens]